MAFCIMERTKTLMKSKYINVFARFIIKIDLFFVVLAPWVFQFLSHLEKSIDV